MLVSLAPTLDFPFDIIKHMAFCLLSSTGNRLKEGAEHLSNHGLMPNVYLLDDILRITFSLSR